MSTGLAAWRALPFVRHALAISDTGVQVVVLRLGHTPSPTPIHLQQTQVCYRGKFRSMIKMRNRECAAKKLLCKVIHYCKVTCGRGLRPCRRRDREAAVLQTLLLDLIVQWRSTLINKASYLSSTKI